MRTHATLFIDPDDPPPVARVMPGGILSMPGGIGIQGEPHQIRAWLQAGLDALADAMVPAAVPTISPEHPSVNHAPKRGAKNYWPLCEALAGTVGAGPVTCPLCLQMLAERSHATGPHHHDDPRDA